MKIKKTLSILLVVLLCFLIVGCKQTAVKSSSEAIGEVTKLGNGKNTVSLTVTNQNGKAYAFEIQTDKNTVGDALREIEFIKGENGLYDTVNGITLDFNKTGLYWAFYVNGKYVNYGIDDAKISKTDKYSLKAQK